MTQGVQVQCSVITSRGGVKWRCEEGSRERGHVFTYGWFVLMYGRN